MTAKKKTDDEASKSTKGVDEAPVDETTVDAEATGVEESTPVDEVVDDSLSTAQSILGVAVTGSMNHGTKQALRQWQRGNGLPPTGQLDTRTKNAMHF
jgi:hypothetical protein